jgi:hypothetical protein
MSLRLASDDSEAALSFAACEAFAALLSAVFEPPQAASEASITAVIAMDTIFLIIILFFPGT